MLQLSQPESIVKLNEVSKKIQIAFEAASEQMNLLCAFIAKPDTFDNALIVKYIPNYSHQAHEMRLVRDKCKQLYQTENLTPASIHTISMLELDSLKLERLSEKIVFLLRYYTKAGESAHLEKAPRVHDDACASLGVN